MDSAAGASGARGHLLHHQASEPSFGWRHFSLREFEQRAPGLVLARTFLPDYEIPLVVKEERQAGRGEGASLLCIVAAEWQETT